MRVQLIHPPILVNRRAIQATRPSLPLGLAYIAARLRAAGHTVSVLDAVIAAPDRFTPEGPLHYCGLGPEEIRESLDPQADVFGLSVMFSFGWPLMRRIAHGIKKRFPDTVLIGGGEHCTGLPELSLEQAPFDYLVLGEGEETFVALADALERGAPCPETIAGVALRGRDGMVCGPPRDRIRDLDALPWPAWDLFDPAAYYSRGFVMGVDTGMTMPILATRGCPYGCTFCSNAMMWRRRWYARSPEQVVEEMVYYHERYGAVNFSFHDLTAVLRKSWMVDFCWALSARNLPITWQLPSGTRCEVIDEEVAEAFYRAGGRSLTLAPESGSERTRKQVGKRIKEPDLMRAVKALVRYRLNVSTFFVIGFPQDTTTDLRQSIRLAFRLAWAGVNDIALSVFFPIPGTPLFDQLRQSGRLTPCDETLMAPIFSMDAAVRREYNYCESLSARALTGYKYSILLTFYAVSFLRRPGRILQIAWNVCRNRETCKMDIFLIQAKRRLWERLRRSGSV